MNNWRFNFIFILFLFGAGTIFSKLYYLQIKKGDYYRALALGQQLSFTKIKGKRGDIFLEGTDLPLAITKKKNIVYIFGKKIGENSNKEELEKKAESLANIFSEEKNIFLSAFFEGKTLKRKISDKQLKQLKKENFKAVENETSFERVYPQRKFSSNIVGFVNNKGEGQYGIEAYYDNILQGRELFEEKEKSPFGYLALLLNPKEKKPSLEGATLFLTIDYNIQYFAEKLLKEAKDKWEIGSGQIIVEEPSTGKILAMANFPDFDPNQYSKQKNLGVFLNSSLQKLFEPGSVFKPITMSAALEERLITPKTKYRDKGYVKLGGIPIYNFKKKVWGIQTMTNVLEKSINTGAVFVEQKLGKNLFLNYLEKFGFFNKTNIDSQGEEFSSNETLKNGYSRDIASASFGQGIAITPIQLICAFGALANGGKLMRPFIVGKIVKANGKVLTTKPQIKREVISKNTSAEITSMLVSVIENGSAKRAKIKGYFIAGKTGTAQVPLQKGGYSKDETIQSFAGYFPASDPKILILIKLDNPKNSSIAAYSAVPLFKEMAEYIIGYKQIPPNY